jgi:hypothetical protein
MIKLAIFLFLTIMTIQNTWSQNTYLTTKKVLNYIIFPATKNKHRFTQMPFSNPIIVFQVLLFRFFVQQLHSNGNQIQIIFMKSS